jgi:hypothetical protein
MRRNLFLILLTWISALSAQDVKTPLQANGYTRATSYQEITAYLQQLDSNSGLLTVEIAGKSVQGRNIYAMKFSSSEFGKDPSKIKVLIFAQQHGNEQSGKEGALMLARELGKPENRYLFDKLDLMLIPQMNPDGSEADKRRNGNDADLNRNHLILTEPETVALHRLFDQYLFEVTMDVHEYYPYSEIWKKYGYRNNTDELIGTVTNPSVSEKIRELSNMGLVPFMKKYCNERGISSFIYAPGGPPEIDYIRRSTFDINDGRQSFGIQNSFSFIQEGLNAEDSITQNIQHRAEGQMTGMRGLLEYTCQHNKEIKKLVAEERKKIIHGKPGEIIPLQMEHVKNGEKLYLPVYSYFSKTDSVIIVNDYRPVVKSINDVKKPIGYLVPKQQKPVVDWIARQGLITGTPDLNSKERIEEYSILSIDSIDFEGDIIVNPVIVAKTPDHEISAGDYIYIPTAQLKGNMIVYALEPKSMLGLATYQQFAYLLKAGENYPVLRVIKK